MKRILLFLVLLCIPVMAKYIAVLETMSDKNLLTLQERQYLTDILRSHAIQVLPAEQNYTIMTRENINVMLPPGKTIEDCEGSCLAETGKNIAADYVAQARITLFGETMAISVEMYETSSSKLMASFNGRGANVNELLVIIQNSAPTFFRKIKERSDGSSFFGDFSYGGAFDVGGEQQYIIEIETNPPGAIPTIDGKANPKCTSTPCRIQVTAGEHRFVVSKESYIDDEKVVNIKENNQKVQLKLLENFGYLDLRPKLIEGIGSPENLTITLNSNPIQPGLYTLGAGTHTVLISHPCYDPVEFSVSIRRGAKAVYDSTLKRGVGGLNLSAELNGEPAIRPVYVNGQKAGVTPFNGKVPLCSDVAIGNIAMEPVDVKLRWHEYVEVTHQLQDHPTPIQQELPKDEGIQFMGPEPKDPEESAGIQKRVDILTNISSKKSQVHWTPIGISALTIITGTTMAIIGNSNARRSSEKDFSSKAEYEDLKKDVRSGQTLRTVGIGLAIAGSLGLGLSFVF